MNAPKSALDELRIERQDARASQPKRWLWLLAALLLAASVAIGLGLTRPQAIEITSAPARCVAGGSASLTVLNASGYVTARRKATISAKVTGKVMEVRVEEGLRVEAGQVLARLDDSNVKASLDVAESQLDSARLNLGETRALLK